MVCSQHFLIGTVTPSLHDDMRKKMFGTHALSPARPDRNRRLSANVCLSCRGFAICALWAQHPHMLGFSRSKEPIRHARPFFFMSLFKRALSKKKECLSGKRNCTVAAQRILPVMGLGGPCVRRRFGTSRCCHAFQGKQGRMDAAWRLEGTCFPRVAEKARLHSAQLARVKCPLAVPWRSPLLLVRALRFLCLAARTTPMLAPASTSGCKHTTLFCSRVARVSACLCVCACA